MSDWSLSKIRFSVRVKKFECNRDNRPPKKMTYFWFGYIRVRLSMLKKFHPKSELSSGARETCIYFVTVPRNCRFWSRFFFCVLPPHSSRANYSRNADIRLVSIFFFGFESAQLARQSHQERSQIVLREKVKIGPCVLLCFIKPILGNCYGPGVSSCQQTSDNNLGFAGSSQFTLVHLTIKLTHWLFYTILVSSLLEMVSFPRHVFLSYIEGHCM